MPESRFAPKLLTVLREGYTRAQLGRDVAAGVLVGVVALPLAIAFAIASGVEPGRGLVTAVVAGFLIAALSGSRVQIGGPTGAFVVLVAGIVGRHGYDGLAVATMMAGAMLVLMGAAGLGRVIQFIPYPVTLGFTSGIALVILTGQVRDALGLSIERLPPDFPGQVRAYAAALPTANPWAVAVAAAALAVIVGWPRLTRGAPAWLARLPGSLVAILALSAAVAAAGLPVETIGSRFGAVPSGLPAPRLPDLRGVDLRALLSPALSIALLGAIESLLSAVVADGMTGRRHRSNTELVAQGVANLVTPLFGGIPATGAIARTATNVRAGGRTPVAGIVHALTLLAILVAAGRWAALIPLPVLAAVLAVVAVNMSEWPLFVRMFRGPRSDVLVLLATFGLTVLVDLSVAIQAGVVLAALLFMRRMAEVTQVGALTAETPEEPEAEALRGLPAGVVVYEINGPFFFGAADTFKRALGEIERAPRVLVLRMRHVPAVDATGLRALEEVLDRTRREGTTLLLAGVHAQPMFAMRRAGLLDAVGDECLFGTVEEAVAHARALVGAPVAG